jgi:hypothetical protein
VAGGGWWCERSGWWLKRKVLVGDLIFGFLYLVAELFGYVAIDKAISRIPSFAIDKAINDLENVHGYIRRIDMSSNFKILHSEKSGYLSWQPIFDLQSQSIKKSVVRHLPESRARMLLKVKNKNLYQQEFGKS